MRLLPLLVLSLIPVAAAAQGVDGPVAGGAFGPSGSDYFGDLHERPPFAERRITAAPRPRPARLAAARPRPGKAAAPVRHGP